MQTAVFHPDLILMDLVMPGVDGLEATRQIRRHQNYRDLPIIALSANIDAETQQESLTAGCDGFLSKPFETEAVLTELECYLPLQWIYEAEDAVLVDHSQFDDEDIIPPNWEELEELLKLTMLGNIGGVKRRLNDLGTEDVKYAPFVAYINQLAAIFKMTEIEQYLREQLGDKYETCVEAGRRTAGSEMTEQVLEALNGHLRAAPDSRA